MNLAILSQELVLAMVAMHQSGLTWTTMTRRENICDTIIQEIAHTSVHARGIDR